MAHANRDYLRGLYGVIKASDAHVRFTFLTGVSKFTKVSLFSDLNNLTDITLDAAYSSICGYTEGDLDTVFEPELAGLNRERVRDWYNGYSWLGDETVYNPYDVLLLLRSRKFKAHWFETGTPAFLVDTLFQHGVASVSLDQMMGTEDLLSAFDVNHIGTEALLFQTGYLTITGEDELGGEPLYRLGYPNREVRQSLNRVLLRRLVQDAARQTANSVRGGGIEQPRTAGHGGTHRRARVSVRVQGGGDGAAGIGTGAVAGAWVRGQVPGPGRADPSGRGGVQPRDAQRDGVRGGGRLIQAPARRSATSARPG